MLRSCTPLTLLLILCCPLTAQTGVVEGVVQTPTGQAVPDATVILDPQSSGEYIMRRAITNNQGEFSFDHVVPGEYAIYAQKEQDGYGDVGYRFFGLGKPPLQRVIVAEQREAVRINIGEPDGQLRISVLDQNGKPVNSAHYRLSAVDNPNVFIDIAPHKDAILYTPVPPVPIFIDVGAPGYRTWRSNRLLIDSRHVEAIRVVLVPGSDLSRR